MATKTKAKPKSKPKAKATAADKAAVAEVVEEAKQEAMSEQADFTLVGVSDDRGGVPVPATAAAVNTVIDTAKLGPLTPEELAAYDAETVRLVNEAEAIAKSAEYAYENSKAVASEDKKRFEAKLADLRGLIHERSENRGKRPKLPEPTLLDVLPKWASLPLSTLEISPDLAERIAKHTSDLGGLDQIINSDGEPWEASDSEHFGLTLDEVADLRAKLKAVTEKEAAAPAPESDLYKQYPIDRWERFGLTKKDIEKLHACETKGTASGFPIRTMGDLQRFSQPNPACPSYTQTVRDIKGIGDAGFDRIGEAELLFWGWWRAGGEAEFAAELAAKDAPAAPESEAA